MDCRTDAFFWNFLDAHPVSQTAGPIGGKFFRRRHFSASNLSSGKFSRDFIPKYNRVRFSCRENITSQQRHWS